MTCQPSAKGLFAENGYGGLSYQPDTAWKLNDRISGAASAFAFPQSTKDLLAVGVLRNPTHDLFNTQIAADNLFSALGNHAAFVGPAELLKRSFDYPIAWQEFPVVVPPKKKRELHQKNIIQITHYSIDHLEVYMAKYQIVGGQQGAVGDNAQANVIFNQTSSQFEKNFDYEELARELSKLRQQLKAAPTTPENVLEYEEAALNIGKAELAAKEKDTKKLVTYLQATGKFVLDFASKVGASLVAEALKQSSGHH